MLLCNFFRGLALAWAGRKVVRIWYPSTDGGEARSRLIEPYFLEPSLIGHSLYVVARDRGLEEMRTFKVERISRAEVSQETYAIPADFDVNEYLARAWGIFRSPEPVDVHLRFYPPAAARVRESVWHPSQELIPNDDGTLDMKVRVAGTVEITPWILGWGESVEVIAPANLRKRIADIGGQLNARNA